MSTLESRARTHGAVKAGAAPTASNAHCHGAAPTSISLEKRHFLPVLMSRSLEGDDIMGHVKQTTAQKEKRHTKERYGGAAVQHSAPRSPRAAGSIFTVYPSSTKVHCLCPVRGSATSRRGSSISSSALRWKPFVLIARLYQIF